MTIPILNLTRQYEQLKTEIDAALIRVASSGHYILGPEVTAFESEMAQYLKVQHVVGCANGTDALFLALKALKIGPGDEVITTPFSFMATSEAIVHAGATPVFVDIEPETMNIDVNRLEDALTPRTRAILPVHIFGQPADMNAILSFAGAHGLFVVEDCAQAIGAEYKGQKTGTMGDIGCFSFFPSKNLGAMGDGGMCTTNNPELAERLKMLRVHGSRKRYYHEEPGVNSRLDEIQAAILRIKLKHLDEWLNARRAVAKRYTEKLASVQEVVKAPVIHADRTHVFHQYTLQMQGDRPAERREQLQKKLADAQIQSIVYYPVPLYKQATHTNLNIDPACYPACERVSDQVFSLPMFPELSLAEQDNVCQVLVEAARTLPVTASRC